MDRLLSRLERFRESVETRENLYAMHHLVFELRRDGREHIMRVVHDTTSDMSLARMKQCRTYVVASCGRRFEGIETRMCVVHGKASTMDFGEADALLRRLLNNARPEPTLDCTDPRIGKSNPCTFGIQPTRLRRASGSGPPVYRWKKVFERPPRGREIVSKSLFTELKKQDSIMWTEVALSEHVMKQAIPVSLKNQWRPVRNKPPGTPIAHCDALVSLLRSNTAIMNEDVWNDCLLPEPVFDIHFAYDSVTKEYYIPAPVDLLLGDFVRLSDTVFYVYSGNPHMNEGGVPLEDRRFIYLPAFTWTGEDCDTGVFLSTLNTFA